MSNYGSSKADYNNIIKWVKTILSEGSTPKKNFYTIKSTMKLLGLGYQKIDMCPNFYTLFYDEDANLTECKNFGHL